MIGSAISFFLLFLVFFFFFFFFLFFFFFWGARERGVAMNGDNLRRYLVWDKTGVTAGNLLKKGGYDRLMHI